MAITGIIFLSLMVISLFVFIYIIVKSARGWGGLHTTMLIFIFLFTLVFMYGAAGVLHRRVAWIQVHDRLQAKLADLEVKAIKLQYGDLERSTPDGAALIPTINKLERQTVDRGRVWRNVQMISPTRTPSGQIDSVRLEVVPPAPATDPVTGLPVASVAPEGIPAQLLVYAFGEIATADGFIIPNVYLGEYFVDSTEGRRSVLRPTSPLLPRQINAIDTTAARWSIYELMPLDSHDAFAKVGSEPTDDSIFGEMEPKVLAELLGIRDVDVIRHAMEGMDPKLLTELFGIPPEVLAVPLNELSDPSQARQARMLRAYFDDGKPGTDDLPPDSLWIRVKFVQDHTIDVDSQATGLLEGGFFDESGRTVDVRLKRGEQRSAVPFKVDDTRVFLKETAEDLIDRGIAILIQRIYVRPLNDYEFAFRNIRARKQEAEDDIALINRENSTINSTNLKSQALIGIRQVERQELDKDAAQYTKERDVIQSESERLTVELESVRKKLIDLFNEKRNLHKQLVDAQLGLAQAINAVLP